MNSAHTYDSRDGIGVTPNDTEEIMTDIHSCPTQPQTRCAMCPSIQWISRPRKWRGASHLDSTVIVDQHQYHHHLSLANANGTEALVKIEDEGHTSWARRIDLILCGGQCAVAHCMPSRAFISPSPHSLPAIYHLSTISYILSSRHFSHFQFIRQFSPPQQHR